MRWYSGQGRTFPWREDSAGSYIKVVSEILLQRTRAETVATFLVGFLNEYPEWSALAQASERDIGSALTPLGLWRRRAAGLKLLALDLKKRDFVFPSDREQLEEMPAVGQYVASAVLLFVYGLPEPLLDGGVARVIGRVFGPGRLADIRDDPHLQSMARALVSATPDHAGMNWALLDLAAAICRPIPKCKACPILEFCDEGAVRVLGVHPGSANVPASCSASPSSDPSR